MSDTLYAQLSADMAPAFGAFFGANAARHPAEPQALCIVPRRVAADALQVGPRRFNVPDTGFSYAMIKPSWTAGAHAGINEKGLAMSVQLVRSRFKAAKDGVSGMEILRAALAVSSSAEEARDFICERIAHNDQGGNSAFRGKTYRDSTYCIADSTGAFVLETAGRRWAWRPAGSPGADAADVAAAGTAASPADNAAASSAGPLVEAMSSAYCISDDYKRLDPQTRKEIAPVNEKAACSDEADPGRKGEKTSWRARVQKKWPFGYIGIARADARRALALSLLGEAGMDKAGMDKGGILSFLDMLRAHGDFNPEKPLCKRMKSLCVHAGRFPRQATTASIAVEWRPDGVAVLWFSDGSYPCMSLYRPILLARGEFLPLYDVGAYGEQGPAAYAHWQAQRKWIASHRRLTGTIMTATDPAFITSRDIAQSELALIADRAAAEFKLGADKRMLDIFHREANAVVAGWEKDVGLKRFLSKP